MKTSIRIIFMLLLSLLFLNRNFAQTQTITGKILNAENKDAIPAASVLLKNSTSGTYTDGQGIFKITFSHPFPDYTGDFLYRI